MRLYLASLFSGATMPDRTKWTAIRSWLVKLIMVGLWMATLAVCTEAQATGQQPATPSQPGHPVAFALAVIGLLLLFCLLDLAFPVLRDQPVRGAAKTDSRQPYSLGRCQIALWTAIVVVSAVYVYLLKGAAPGQPLELINGTAAILIGISGATGLTSSFVDSTKDQKLSAAQAKKAANEAEIADLTKTKTTTVDSTIDQKLSAARAKKAQTESEIAALTRTKTSNDFLHDILVDGNGNSLHRVQMVIFTLVLGVIFCLQVVNQTAMPTFSQATLGLIGISSGTYVGFKIPGK